MAHLIPFYLPSVITEYGLLERQRDQSRILIYRNVYIFFSNRKIIDQFWYSGKSFYFVKYKFRIPAKLHWWGFIRLHHSSIFIGFIHDSNVSFSVLSMEQQQFRQRYVAFYMLLSIIMFMRRKQLKAACYAVEEECNSQLECKIKMQSFQQSEEESRNCLFFPSTFILALC